MPLLRLKTNVTIDNKEKLLKTLSAETAKILGKPESYVMVIIDDQQMMSFGGKTDATAFFEVFSLGEINADQSNRFSANISKLLQESAGIDASRIYSAYHPWKERHLWGYDGGTF